MRLTLRHQETSLLTLLRSQEGISLKGIAKAFGVSTLMVS